MEVHSSMFESMFMCACMHNTHMTRNTLPRYQSLKIRLLKTKKQSRRLQIQTITETLKTCKTFLKFIIWVYMSMSGHATDILCKFTWDQNPSHVNMGSLDDNVTFL